MVALVVFALAVFVLPFAFPTPPPIITRFTATQLFSPNQDGARDAARISVRVREPGAITVEVVDSDGVVRRRLADQQPTRHGWLRLSWHGLDDDGEPVPDGDYTLRLHATAPGDKHFRTSRRIRIDTTPPLITQAQFVSALTPHPEGAQCRVRTVTDADAQVEILVLADEEGTKPPLRRFGPTPARAGRPIVWPWDGRGGSGPLTAGLHTVRIIARDPARNSVSWDGTCWVGNLTAAVRGPVRPGSLVRVVTDTTRGVPLPDTTPVRLQLYRRIGTPGSDREVLGRRVARPVVTTAGDARIRIPAAVAPSSLWLVVSAGDGRALVPLGGGG